MRLSENQNYYYEENEALLTWKQNKKSKRIYLIKNPWAIKNAVMSQAQINWILAQNIIKSLDRLKCANSIKESYLNKIDFKVYCQLSKFIIDLLTEDIKGILYNIILLSKTTNLINLASSNSITFLNKVGFSFNNRDLSNAKIPNSDLSYGVFINTNFESCNLYGANLSMTSIYDSNFKNCNIIEANFGEAILRDGLKADLLLFSPCGKFLAISCENVLWLYEVATFTEIAQFLGHNHSLKSLLFSDNGKYLLSHSDDRIILWSCISLLQIDEFLNFRNFLSFSPCSNYLCLVLWEPNSKESTLSIYSINLRKMTKEIRGVYFSLTFAIFSFDGQNLIVLDKFLYLSIWNLSKNEKTSQVLCNYFEPVAISFDRHYISFNYDNAIVIYSIEKFEIIMTLKTNIFVDFFKFSRCGKYLVSASEINGFEIFDLSLQLKIYNYYGTSKWCDKSLAITSNNENLVYGTSDRKLKLWKLMSNNEADNKFLTKKCIRMMSFSNDSKYFAIATEEGKIFIFLAESQNLIRDFQAHSRYILFIDWSENILASISVDCFIKIWSIYDDFPLMIIKTNSISRWIKFSPDGRKILSCDSSNSITIWDIDNNQIIANWYAHYDYDFCYMAQWSPSEDFLVTCSSDCFIKIWRADNQTLLTTLTKHSEGVHLIKFSICGKYLLSCGMDQKIKIWSLADMNKEGSGNVKELKELYVEKPITSIAWSNDMINVIASDVGGKLVAWDLDTRRIIYSINAHKEAATCIDLSSNENFLISTGKDKAVKLWNFKRLKEQFIK